MLCEKLGYPSPRWLLPLLTPEERTYWHAYYELIYQDREEGPTGEDTELRDPSELVSYLRSLHDQGYAVTVDDGG